MRNRKITNLKDLVKAYHNRKSDLEISHMLHIPVDEVRNQRRRNSLEALKVKMGQYYKNRY